MQGGERRRTEDDLVLRFDRMARENGRAESGVCACPEHRDGLAVDLCVSEVESGPCGDVRIVVEKVADHGWDVVTPLRFDGVVPVPPVQRGVGHQGVEPAGEGEGGHHDDDRQHRADQHRADRHGGPAMTRLEGEPEPRDSGGGKTVTRGSVDHGRSPLHGLGPLSDAPACRPAVGESHGQGTKTDGQDGESDPEHGPIEGEPRCPVHLARRTERRQWREGDGENHGQSRTEDHRAEQAKDGVPRHGQRVGPEHAQDVEVVTICP